MKQDYVYHLDIIRAALFMIILHRGNNVKIVVCLKNYGKTTKLQDTGLIKILHRLLKLNQV